MSAENSANNSFSEEKVNSSTNIRLTPPRASSISGSTNLLNEQQSGASNFTLFDDNTTPIQRSTNNLNHNVSTAPPFLRSSNDVNLENTNIPSGLVDINLALGALDLDFGRGKVVNGNDAKDDSTAATAGDADSVEEKDAVAKEEAPATIEGNRFANGFHHQPFHPFFPINGFGQPLHGAFGPSGGGLEHPQPWTPKPGQPPFGNPLVGPGLEGLSHTPPIPHPGMIPIGAFDIGSDGVATPPPPHLQHPQFLHSDFGGIGLKEDGTLKDDQSYPQGFPGVENMGMPFNGQQPHPLQNNQVWPQLNGRPQNFDGFNNGMSQGGPHGMNNGNDRRYPFYTNNGNHHGHHSHHHNHHHGKRLNNRRRGDDASRFANAKLDDFIGQIYSLCKDQHGCRFLQKQLDLDEKNTTPIFEETKSHVVELMIDPFGNYLVQKLLEKVNSEERTTLVKNASSEFVSIALDPHGTRALQKLVERIDSQEEAKIIVEALTADVVLLSRDLNGNHVIQKCLQRLTSDDSQFIFDAANEKCLEIATHRHGCCVLQRCLDFGSAEQVARLSSVVSEIAGELSLDAFGNYVVQYVLAKKLEEPNSKIVQAVKDDFVKLALHKFGSNVIEKCLRIHKFSQELIGELLKHEEDFVKLLNDSFGNYVLQTSLDVAKGEQLSKLSSILKPLLPEIRNTPHGRRISSRLQHA